MKFYTIIFLILLLTSCKTNHVLNGKYQSNKSELGFFDTELHFLNENDFKFKFSGDLQYKELTGTYKINKNKVYLHLDKDLDLANSESDSLTIVEILTRNYHNHHFKNENEIHHHLKYKIKGDKLFSYRNENGKMIKKTRSYAKTKKFLIFGSKWKKTRHYFKKVNDTII